MTSELTSFADELTKVGIAPILRTNTLRTAAAKMMGVKPPKVPKPPTQGSFKIKTKLSYETMSPAKWKQTAKDMPVVIGATGVGWGIGKTIADVAGEKMFAKAMRTGKKPAFLKHAPLVTGALSGLGTYAMMRTREEMKNRREAAEKQAGVPPAPQSRKIPRKKPSDPWRYDPRPAGIFGP